MMTAFYSLAGASVLTKKIGGKENTELHGNLAFAAAMAAGFGGYVIWTNKDMYGKAHLTTDHGQFGALTLTLMLAYPIVSYILYNPESGFLRQHQLFRKVHKYTGKLILVFGLVTSAYGIMAMEQEPIQAAGLIGALLISTPVFLF